MWQFFLWKKSFVAFNLCSRQSTLEFRWSNGSDPSMGFQSNTSWSNRIVATVIFRLPTERICNLLLNILLKWPMATNSNHFIHWQINAFYFIHIELFIQLRSCDTYIFLRFVSFNFISNDLINITLLTKPSPS